MHTRRMRKPLNRSRRLWLERLEARQVLAASVGLDAGVLTIVGTNKNDRVTLSEVEGQLHVVVNKTTQDFVLTDVTQISIDVGNGNDRVEISDAVVIDAVIVGGRGNDWLRGGGGNDTISGNAGNDHVDGGLGNDLLNGDAGNDKVVGGDGDDELHGGAGQDGLWGGAGNDSLFGEAGHDRLSGGDGNDSLSGGFGKDILWGDAGDDTLHGDADHDLLHGGVGNDFVYGDAGHDELWGEAGDDWLEGGDGNDQIRGGVGDDKLKGGAGNDLLNGGEGVNLLDGDAGKNVLKNGTETDFDAPPPPPPTPEFQPLFVQLTGPGVLGEASYGRQDTEVGPETFLDLSIHGAPANQTFDIQVNGVKIGEVTVDGSGDGVVHLSSLAGEEGGTPLPTDFAPAVGDTLTVGNLALGNIASGQLAAA